MKRYTEYFGAQQDAQNNYVPGSYTPHQGFNIAKTMLNQHDNNLAAVMNWWAPIANDPDIPEELRRSALNSSAYLASGNLMWVNGLVENNVAPTTGNPADVPNTQKRLGTAIPDTHLFAISTGSDGADESAQSSDVTQYNQTGFNLLFPNAERDYLRATAEGTLLSSNSQTGEHGQHQRW